jgi:hypothetical protein
VAASLQGSAAGTAGAAGRRGAPAAEAAGGTREGDRDEPMTITIEYCTM